jgi:hypothetical protein
MEKKKKNDQMTGEVVLLLSLKKAVFSRGE